MFKIIKKIIFLLLIMVLMPLSTFANEITEDYFDIAINYCNQGNTAKALEYLDYILQIEPQNIDALALKNKLLPQEINKTAEAPQAPVKVTIEVPKVETEHISYDSDYYNTKGKEFYDKKDYTSATDYFRKSVIINPKNYLAYNNLGMVYWMKNDLPSAEKAFKKAHSLCRQYTQPLVNLSLLYKQLGDTKKQLKVLNDAIYCNGNDYWAYYLKGEYYKSLGEYPIAIENYKESLKINQKFAQSFLAVAICFFETEEFNWSLGTLKQYLSLNPKSDFGYSLAAKNYEIIGNYAEAKNNIATAIALNDTPEYRYELGKIEYAKGEFEEALAVFNELEKTVNTAELYNYIGLCQYRLRKIEYAISNFNRAINIDGLRPIYYYNLAQCYKSLGDKRNYVKYVNTATQISPVTYQDYIDLSCIYFDNANPNYALNTLNGGIEKYPNVKSLYLAKLKIYEAIGDNLRYNETKSEINMRFNKNEEKKTKKERNIFE